MKQIFLDTPLFPVLFLFASLLLTACGTSLMYLGKYRSKEILKKSPSPLFFFRKITKRFFPKYEWENLYFCISTSKHIYELGFAILTFIYLTFDYINTPQTQDTIETSQSVLHLVLTGLSIVAVSVLLSFITRLAAHLWSSIAFYVSAPFASFFLTILFPLTGPLLKLIKTFSLQVHFEEDLQDRAHLKEIIKETDISQHLDPFDQKLINSFLHFKDRVAKEIMVPRVDVFTLSASTTVQDAIKLFAREGYSRIPIFKESLDQIVGVTLYKDLLRYLAEDSPILSAPIENIAKPVLYAPENKKISLLLQEFRSKKIHMAIIVDEYGGTEGIVTIEDILEELVGEIEDEFDAPQDQLFSPHLDGGWIVDAKMTLIDIENQLNIKIPEHPDYETLGGYVFHCAGSIPSKGWRLSHDEFDLEILISNERSLKKIKLNPRPKNPEL